MHNVIDDQSLRNPVVSSSPLRKFCRILALEGEGGERSQCIICVDGVAAGTIPMEDGRSRLSGRGVDIKTYEYWRSRLCGGGVDIAESIFVLARLAESILWDSMNLKF